jgi:group II intron reverse transcriptase/maturase
MSRIKETITGRVGLSKGLQTSLYGIERKAEDNKNHKFENLYGLLNRWNLSYAWNWINKKASYGIDKQSAKEFEKCLKDEVLKLERELKEERYHAKLVKRIFIEKSNGGKRPLGIPTIRDKLLQIACSRILEAIYEPEFIDTSFGYRRGKNAKKAVKCLSDELKFGKYLYVVEADIKGFFDNMSHEWIMKMLEHRISDKRFLNLIRKWLKAGIMKDDGTIEKSFKGTPQGGVISPILANIYLHYALDIWFEKVVPKHIIGECKLVRYADDYVCAFRYKQDAEKFMYLMETRLKKFNLKLSEEKTRLVRFNRYEKEKNGTFDFLGFTFRWELSRKGNNIITRKTSKEKYLKSIKNAKEWIKGHRNCRLRKIFDLLNSKLRGYYNYYGIIGNYKMINKFHTKIFKLLYK